MLKPLTTAILFVALLSGCVPEKEGVDGFDLQLAYYRCVGTDDDNISYRIACTQAVYGGHHQ